MVSTQDSHGIQELSDETWSVLERLARALHVKNAELQPTLDAIVSTAVHTIGSAQYAGLILLVRGELVPQATAGGPPHTLDVLQHELGTGPCIDAAREQAVVRVVNMAADQRWPTLAERAVSLGVASMLCVPLRVDEADSLIPFSAYLGIGFAVALMYAGSRAYRRQHRGLSLASMAVGLAVTLYALSWLFDIPGAFGDQAGFASEIGVYVGLVGAALWTIGSGLLAKEPEGDPEHDRVHYDNDRGTDGTRGPAGR
jgi:putative methionine-R-sulfoxide reductase with GAF domain